MECGQRNINLRRSIGHTLQQGKQMCCPTNVRTTHNKQELQSRNNKDSGIIEIIEPCNFMAMDTVVMFNKKIVGDVKETHAVEAAIAILKIPVWAGMVTRPERTNGKKTNQISLYEHNSIGEVIRKRIEATNRLQEDWDLEAALRIGQESLTTSHKQGISVWIITACVIAALILCVAALIWIWRFKDLLGMATREIRNINLEEIDVEEHPQSATTNTELMVMRVSSMNHTAASS